MMTTTQLSSMLVVDVDVSVGEGLLWRSTSPFVLPTPNSTRSIMENSNNDKKNLYLLRGPLLLGAVVVAASFPFFVQLGQALYEGQTSAVLLVLFFLACSVMIYDFLSAIKTQAPRVVDRLLKRIVLDDWLRALYDPTEGLLAAAIGCTLGNAAMYALPCTPEERVEIVQANLAVAMEPATAAAANGTTTTRRSKTSTSQEQQHVLAQSILREPGGIRHLLPQAAQVWLQQSNGSEHSATASTSTTVKATAVEAEKQWTLTTTATATALSSTTTPPDSCNSSMDDSDLLLVGVTSPPRLSTTAKSLNDVIVEDEHQSGVPNRIKAINNKPSHPPESPLHHPPSLEQRRQGDPLLQSPPIDDKATAPAERPKVEQQTPPRLPHEILASILVKSMKESMQEHVPVERVLQTTSVLAALLLVMQHSRRARRVCWSMLSVSTTASLSTIFMGAVAALVYRKRDSASTPTSFPSAAVATSSWLDRLNSMARSCWNESQRRRWKGIVAVLVMFYFGRRRNSRRGLQR